MSRRTWSVVTEVSRAVAARAITEREACVEVWARTGGDPRALVRAIRAGVRILEVGEPGPMPPPELERELRRLRAAPRN